jgi:hypothetical protein
MQKLLILAGIVLVLLGVAWPFLQRMRIGQLPGDIIIREGNLTIYLPLVTSLVLSILLSLLMWIINR